MQNGTHEVNAVRKKDFLESIPEDPAEVLANWRDIR
jgi:hypothetical protein